MTARRFNADTVQEAIAQDSIAQGMVAQESKAGEAEETAEVTYVTVEDDYFTDALFIGDSRTVGLLEYGELEDIATFYASTGLTIFRLYDNKAVKLFGRTGKHKISEYLEEREYGKIYLMVGLNEMGTGDLDYYIKKYRETLDMIREAQPDAIIYVQAIIKLTARQAEREAYVTNEELEERNERLAEFADNEKIFFLDVNPELCVEDGGLNPEYTSDGTHLKAQYISIWKDFLKCHAVEIPKKYQTLQPF